MTAALPHKLAFVADSSDELAAGAGECGKPLALRFLDPASLGDADQLNWDRLAIARSGDSVFAEPWLMRLSLVHFDKQRRVRLAVVADGQGAWIGVLPLVRRHRLGRLFWPHWAGWGHANQFNNTPLVRDGKEEVFWQALLAGLDDRPGGAISLCLADLPADDPVNAALAQVCQSARRNWKEHRRYSRASLLSDQQVQQRLDAVLSPKSRRRLESLERQLAGKHGPAQLRSTRNPAEIAVLIDRFLELESAGWKGAAGSALDRAEETRDFFRSAALAAAQRGRFEVSSLEVGCGIIAMTTQFLGAEWSCGFKRAHDERFARFAPGLIHLRHLTRHLVEQGGPSFDSCAAPDQQSINRMWPDRRELFDCTIAIGGPLRSAACSALAMAMDVFHRIKRRHRAEPQGDSAR